VGTPTATLEAMGKNGVTKTSVLVLGLFLSIGATSCDFPGANGSGSNSGVAAATTSTQLNSSSEELAIQAVSAQEMNLGTSISVPVTIQSQNGYSGSVNLSINSKVLAANDPMGTISVSVAPPMINIGPNDSAQVMVSLSTLSSSPDLNSSISLIASTSAGQVESSIPIQVNPVFEVDSLGPKAASEDWSVSAGSTVKFTQHVNGIKINFVNKVANQASGTVRIHSNNVAYQHQGTDGLGVAGQTASPDVTQAATSTAGEAVTAGDTYSVNVTSQSSMLTETSYDHNNENGGTAGRKFVFNAFSVPPVIGSSGNPNASYAYIKANMVTPICASCHVSAQDGGVSLSSYTSTLSYLQKGSASGSALYIAIAAGGTMPENDPGSVSAALVKDVQDWINDGANNN